MNLEYSYTFHNRPSGWDNMKKISILHENLVSMKPDDYYRNVISPPVSVRKVSSESSNFYRVKMSGTSGLRETILF